MKKTLIHMEELEIGYRTARGVERAAGPLTLSLFEGEAVGLIGESGAGKSSVGLEILGLISYKGGQRISGRLHSEIRPEEIGFIPQDPLSALDPLFSIGSQLRETDASQNNILEALRRARLPLEKISLKSYPHELSGGMRQRLVIAMALLRQPRLLIADEPTSSLDMTLQAEIMKLFSELHGQGISFLFITHNLPLAALFCDRLAVMRKGSIVETGTPEKIMNRPENPYTKELVASVPVLKR